MLQNYLNETIGYKNERTVSCIYRLAKYFRLTVKITIRTVVVQCGLVPAAI